MALILSRRGLLTVAALAAAPGALRAQPIGLPGAPEVPGCRPRARLTPAQTAGPFYKAGSPRRNVLVAGEAGQRVRLAGFVLSRDCRPVPGARVDVWQADGNGDYDNRGFRLRGHQATDAQGRWAFDTVMPGEYPGRTPHVHVRVTPPGGRTLTTQLYFPGVAGNARDGIFDPALILTMNGAVGRYDFVVNA